jgi:hypothetical protein
VAASSVGSVAAAAVGLTRNATCTISSLSQNPLAKMGGQPLLIFFFFNIYLIFKFNFIYFLIKNITRDKSIIEIFEQIMSF